HDRLAILERLVNYWHGPIRPEDAISEADLGGLPLPMPLRWWYRWTGKRSEILGRQNRLLVPRDFERRYNMLRINNGRLCFYDENQGVYQWSTDRTGDDPPVFGRYEGKGRWSARLFSRHRSQDRTPAAIPQAVSERQLELRSLKFPVGHAAVHQHLPLAVEPGGVLRAVRGC
ncbi:MAG TPA: hypothetical protein VJ783_08865, partial [Pirellulales bacterium]|nr:hypothetical protein [Pirellulales bacterium]